MDKEKFEDALRKYDRAVLAHAMHPSVESVQALRHTHGVLFAVANAEPVLPAANTLEQAYAIVWGMVSTHLSLHTKSTLAELFAALGTTPNDPNVDIISATVRWAVRQGHAEMVFPEGFRLHRSAK